MKWMQKYGTLNIIWGCSSLGLEWKLTFLVLWPLLSFPYMLAIECSTFIASSSRIWNSSTGILSPPLALFVVMLPKAHLTLHSGCLALGKWSWESHFLRRLIRSLGVPKERGVWNSQGGRKDKLFSLSLHSSGLYNTNVSCLRTVSELNLLLS